MTLLQIEIIVAIWLLFGLIGVILDMSIKENRNEYKTISLLTLLIMLVGHIILGAIAFRWALIEFMEYKKKKK